MTTTLQKAIVPNNHLVLTGITWEKFEQIETTFQDIEGIRFIYLDGELEIIMNLGQEHEYYKRTISLLLEAYCREKRVRFYAGGSATLGNKNITGRKEPDESYTIHSKRDIPDLIIEVIFSHLIVWLFSLLFQHLVMNQLAFCRQYAFHGAYNFISSHELLA